MIRVSGKSKFKYIEMIFKDDEHFEAKKYLDHLDQDKSWESVEILFMPHIKSRQEYADSLINELEVLVDGIKDNNNLN